MYVQVYSLKIWRWHDVSTPNSFCTDPVCWFHDEPWYMIVSVTWATHSRSVHSGVTFNYMLPLAALVKPRLRLMSQSVCLLKTMENFWMYQAEKLEEEQAKWKKETDHHERDEVWLILQSLLWFWSIEVIFSVCI